jgi:integrase/recombinase XerD
MSALQETLDEYLAARRALGHKLLLPGRLLQRFVTFADSAEATHITAEIALAWAMQPVKAQPAQWANRLAMVRRFARYCHALEREPSFRPTIFFHTGIAGRLPLISIATAKSPH